MEKYTLKVIQLPKNLKENDVHDLSNNTELIEYCRDVLHYGIFNTDDQSNEYDIKIQNDGLVLLPIYPITYQINENLYNDIYGTLNLALTPELTLIRPLSMQVVTFDDVNRNVARGIWFPWRVGKAKRLTADFATLYRRYTTSSRIPIMDIIDWDFRKSPHLIVTGVSGSGKSFFLSYLLKMCSRIGRVLVIDPKSSDLARWARHQPDVETVLPGFIDGSKIGSQQGIGTSYLQAVNKRLKDVESIMYQRQSKLYQESERVSTDYSELELKPYFIIADELAALMTGAPKSLRDEFQSTLTRIVVLGRESGVYLVMAMQSARAEYIPTIVRDSISVRIQLGRINSENTKFLFPELKEMPMIPLGGKGTGIISIAGDDRYAGIEPVSTPTIRG